jgi:hypothetical protein
MALIIYPSSGFDSFVTLADATSNLTNNVIDITAWTALTDAKKEIYLRQATLLIKSKIDPIGFLPDIYYYTDFSHMPNQDRIFLSTYPIIVAKKENKMIIKSSPNGHNFFESLVNNITKNNFEIQKIYWYDIPNRDHTWEEEIIKIIGQKMFDQDYNLQFLEQ